MRLGLLGYTQGSVFNRTSKKGIYSPINEDNLGLTANKKSVSSITRKSGIYRPEINGTKMYYKGDIQSFYTSPSFQIQYTADQPSGLEIRDNGSVFYPTSGRGDVFGSPFESGFSIVPTTRHGSVKTATSSSFNLYWRTGVFGSTFYPELQALRFRPSDGLRLFGVGTLTSSSGSKVYYGTVFYMWRPSSAYSLTSSAIPGAPSTDIGVFPEYFLPNVNGSSPSSTPIDDPLTTGDLGAAGLRVSDAFMHPDGLIFYYLNKADNKIYQGSLNSAWFIGVGTLLGTDVTSLNTASLSVPSTDRSFTFNENGTKLFTFGDSLTITQYNLSSAWQISSASQSSTLNLSNVSPTSNALRIGIRMVNTNSTIITLSRTNTSGGTDSNGILSEINQALY